MAEAAVGVEHQTAREGGLLRPVAHDEAVTGEREQRRFAADLSQRASTGLKRSAVEQMHARRGVRAAQVHAHQRAVLERSRRAGFRSREAPGFFQQHVERVARCAQFGQRDHVAALDRVRVNVWQV